MNRATPQQTYGLKSHHGTPPNAYNWMCNRCDTIDISGWSVQCPNCGAPRNIAAASSPKSGADVLQQRDPWKYCDANDDNNKWKTSQWQSNQWQSNLWSSASYGDGNDWKQYGMSQSRQYERSQYPQQLSGRNNKRPPCFSLLKWGSCAQGDNCRYSHDVQTPRRPKPVFREVQCTTCQAWNDKNNRHCTNCGSAMNIPQKNMEVDTDTSQRSVLTTNPFATDEELKRARESPFKTPERPKTSSESSPFVASEKAPPQSTVQQNVDEDVGYGQEELLKLNQVLAYSGWKVDPFDCSTLKLIAGVKTQAALNEARQYHAAKVEQKAIWQRIMSMASRFHADVTRQIKVVEDAIVTAENENLDDDATGREEPELPEAATDLIEQLAKMRKSQVHQEITELLDKTVKKITKVRQFAMQRRMEGGANTPDPTDTDSGTSQRLAAERRSEIENRPRSTRLRSKTQCVEIRGVMRPLASYYSELTCQLTKDSDRRRCMKYIGQLNFKSARSLLQRKGISVVDEAC